MAKIMTRQEFINSQDYANDKEFDSVIEIIGTKYNSLTFNIRNKEMQVKSKYDSANTLNFQTPMNEKNENISKWKNYQKKTCRKTPKATLLPNTKQSSALWDCRFSPLWQQSNKLI